MTLRGIVVTRISTCAGACEAPKALRDRSNMPASRRRLVTTINTPTPELSNPGRCPTGRDRPALSVVPRYQPQGSVRPEGSRHTATRGRPGTSSTSQSLSAPIIPDKQDPPFQSPNGPKIAVNQRCPLHDWAHAGARFMRTHRTIFSRPWTTQAPSHGNPCADERSRALRRPFMGGEEPPGKTFFNRRTSEWPANLRLADRWCRNWNFTEQRCVKPRFPWPLSCSSPAGY
jgi:hypothetical protein